MSDTLRSYIRTFVPVLIGHVAAFLVAAAAKYAGVEIESGFAFEVVAVVLVVLVYMLGRRLESARAGWARWLGRFLLSLGADLGTPTYVASPADGQVRTRTGRPPL